MEEVDNVLKILERTLYAIENDNHQPLKELSDQTIHTASSGDLDNILVAVIVYSIGKILSRPDYRSLKGWNSFYRITTFSLKNSIDNLKNKNEKNFRENFLMIRQAINKIDGKLKKYIEDVFKKAEISKGSRIYEHGVSAGKAANLLGITLYDLQTYTGQTGISEISLNQSANLKQRIKILEEIFK